ncbi:HAMP domain-containing sensor histidine kinase [Halobacillus sp. ACCC02827]|uniref:sensor histidine kinase n=1 Tax=unclassified Halobacillus TaxID=2636472 RepID=UPI0007836738|nr:MULTISPECIES: HAMP domain-containing sensor histidine kinase [unclassified Halobacillus]WJE14953.1 HAMP domain-containing sensor histidine kinase [Halobacillus sp. ACCC02827]
MKLSNKIHVYTTVLFTVLLVLISLSVYFTFSHISYDSDLEQTRLEAERIAAGINEQESTSLSTDLLRAYVPANGMIRIIRRNGQAETVAAGSQQDLADQEYRYYQGEQVEVEKYDETPHAVAAVPVLWMNGEVASLQLTQSLASTSSNLEVLRLVLLVVTILAILPLFLSARILSNLITKPIVSLTDTMQEIRGSGEFKQIETEKQSKDELDQMADAFNQMIIQLERNYERQEQFVSNASHELKTPLTVIESYSSLLKRRGNKDEKLFRESIEAIYSEAKQMRALTQQLLLLAKQEEHWNVKKENIPLVSLLESTVVSFEKAYSRQVRLLSDSAVTVYTDEQKLKQLLYILMDNAKKYSDEAIAVFVKQHSSKVIIDVVDEGIGMTDQELEHVFDRFYQVDQSRSEGYGLGLSLAQELAEAIGAELKLTSIKGKGTTASIILAHSQKNLR